MKKIVAICLSVALITASTPPSKVEASWFSDLMGGIFTVITSPILLVAPNNPTLRKNNPFRKKVWEEEEEKAERERDKEIIKRLSSQKQQQQPAAATTETIVIEKTVEVVKDNLPEINELKKEVADMKKDIGEKTIEIEILQHIVSNVRNGKDGRDGLAGRDGLDCPTKIVMDTPLTNERDLRKFKTIAEVALVVWAINKYFYVPPKIWAYRGDFIYEDRTPRLNVFLQTSATIFVTYCGRKFLNKKLTVNELWTDAKDITMDVGSTLGWAVGGIVGGLNWTLHGAKDVTNSTWNWAMENKHYVWEYPRDYVIYPVGNFPMWVWDNKGKVWDKINPPTIWQWQTVGICMFVVGAIVGSVLLCARYAREQDEKNGFVIVRV
jgi:hypothetical protein